MNIGVPITAPGWVNRLAGSAAGSACAGGLLVGDGDGPAIARYEGRAALKNWILISALREAVRVRHKATREPATAADATWTQRCAYFFIASSYEL